MELSGSFFRRPKSFAEALLKLHLLVLQKPNKNRRNLPPATILLKILSGSEKQSAWRKQESSCPTKFQARTSLLPPSASLACQGCPPSELRINGGDN